MSLSRFKHGLPRGDDEPGMMEGTAAVPPQSATAPLPEAVAVFDAATAFDTTLDMVAPQLTLGELLVRHVLLPRELLPQIEINSIEIRSERAAHVRKQEVQGIKGRRSEAVSDAFLVSVHLRSTHAPNARRSADGITGRASCTLAGIAL